MPTVQEQQDAAAAQRIFRERTVRVRRLVVMVAGLLLVVAGLLLHKNILAFMGLVLILTTNLIMGGGT